MNPISLYFIVPLAFAGFARASDLQSPPESPGPIAPRVSPSESQASVAAPAPNGESQGATEPEITDPVWKKSPYGAWTDDYLPERSVRRNIVGEATVSCIATAAGALADCRVLHESPADAEFGAAAIRVLAHASMKSLTASGAPISGRPYTQTFRYLGAKPGPGGLIDGHWAR
jgi:TonB family protein